MTEERTTVLFGHIPAFERADFTTRWPIYGLQARLSVQEEAAAAGTA